MWCHVSYKYSITKSIIHIRQNGLCLNPGRQYYHACMCSNYIDQSWCMAIARNCFSTYTHLDICMYVCSSRVLQSNSHGMFCTCSTTGVAWSIACEHYTSHLSQNLLDTFRYMQQARHTLRWASSLTVHSRISENNLRHEDTICDQKWRSVCLVLLMLCSALIFLFSSAERWKFVANIIIHSNTLHQPIAILASVQWHQYTLTVRRLLLILPCFQILCISK